ncbi:DUF3431 domain-containing protein [Candidatus Parcubacteria bacterium]|nr:DUF3431 domain-containing protein [Candidatus Parcubacteria bacterium]
MIVTELYNGQGLGNQLWCYVTTRVIAKDKGYEFGIKSPEKFKGADFFNLDFGRVVIGGKGPEGGPPTSLPEGIKNYYVERKIVHPENGVDIRTFDKHLVDIPDNTQIDGVMQDEQYILHRKGEIREWLKVKEEHECYDYADENICVINFRGNEYVQNKRVFLPQKYWDDAIKNTLKVNKNLTFVVITDDVATAKKFFPNYDVFHFSISKDYVIVKNAKYLILSNSSFACLPAWLNKDLRYCIAPKYWSQYNTSDGYWGCSYNIISGWMYQDRNGSLQNAESCRKELDEYINTHKEYFFPRIHKNFLVVSHYNNDIRWIPDLTDTYVIYDQSEKSEYPKTIDISKVIRSKHTGHNISDYLTFIIDNYDALPETTIFGKGNMFPRHVRREYFERVMNNEYFTSLEDIKMHNPQWPKGFFSADGGFCEINNSLYLKAPGHPLKYFDSYNDFLEFCFRHPILPRYTRFAPGAMYIVPKAHILKFPKVFYENLRVIVSYVFFPGEAYIVERALHTIWASSFEPSATMLRPIDPDMTMIKPPDAITLFKEKVPVSIRKRIPPSMKPLIRTALKKARKFSHISYFFKKKIKTAREYINEYKAKKSWLSPQEMAQYRKNIKIYDVVTFLNEFDLLELRMQILDPYVDYFVIVEATETFSGKPKPLYFEENKDRFKKWQHKIIHHVTRDVPKNQDELRDRLKHNPNMSALDKQIINDSLTSNNIAKGAIHWFKEFYQKESIKKALVGLNENDICFVGDVDEIWNPQLLIDYSKNDIFKLRQKVYAYYFNNRSNEPWAGTLVTQYKNIKDACLNHLRTARKTKYIYLQNGGWHFTNMGGADQIRKKLESYGHQEYNTTDIKSDIENKIMNNQDFIGRKTFTFWTDESDLPKYILENKEKYSTYFK